MLGYEKGEISDIRKAFFEELLHLGERAKPPPERPPEQTPTPEGQGAWRALVAEDNVVNQKVAARMLQRLGCEADAVAIGTEALQAIELISYDRILMDRQMPVMDGDQAAQVTRERETGEGHLPIVALTANAMKGDRERCLEGLDRVLRTALAASKPTPQQHGEEQDQGQAQDLPHPQERAAR